ncbi:hypothetical protein GCM10009530_15350 [Microbispora corallina]|uniref:Uncharacterized protein n=1 Tax=Microbispora corallina TaxID=83302 RepID=A0ABQ4FXG3_9ACTN|nr:hypothetical protein MPTA5024_23250 [Microbispora sp. ATCC PTA-5024]GIH39493.1 hypothetical protein Mco01_24930 [Microbispora corallina]
MSIGPTGTKGFGIVNIGFRTRRRIPKEIAVWYRGVIMRNGLQGDE